MMVLGFGFWNEVPIALKAISVYRLLHHARG
jgi:hypothetical protein